MKPEDEVHEHRVSTALREALFTRRHGEMLFEMTADMLGPSARVESTADGNHRTLYRLEDIDPRWVVPWPLLTLDRNPRKTFPFPFPGLKPAPPLPPRPGKAPRLRNLGPGYIQIHDGGRSIQVAYAEDGRWFETSRSGPATTLDALLPVLASGGGTAVERLATFMAALDVARHGPLRVFLPRPDAWNALAAWQVGLFLLRRAVAADALPSGTRWVATDPIDGSTLVAGASRDEVLFAWSAEVERVRPGSRFQPEPEHPSFEPPSEPEIPPAPGEFDEEDERKPPPTLRIAISISGSDPALPQAAPKPPPAENVPAVVLEFTDPPREPAPFGRWRRFLRGDGTVVFGALREDAEGWTLIGAPVLAALGAPDAEAALDEVERALDQKPRKAASKGPRPTPTQPWTVRYFQLLDEATGAPCTPRWSQSNTQPGQDVPPLDGNILACHAVRLRRSKG